MNVSVRPSHIDRRSHPNQCLFRIEREIEDLPSDQRRSIRQRKSRRVLAVFHRWLLAQRQLVPPGSATMKAIYYSLKR